METGWTGWQILKTDFNFSVDPNLCSLSYKVLFSHFTQNYLLQRKLEKPFCILFKEFKNDLTLELLKLTAHRTAEAASGTQFTLVIHDPAHRSNKKLRSRETTSSLIEGFHLLKAVIISNCTLTLFHHAPLIPQTFKYKNCLQHSPQVPWRPMWP